MIEWISSCIQLIWVTFTISGFDSCLFQLEGIRREAEDDMLGKLDRVDHSNISVCSDYEWKTTDM